MPHPTFHGKRAFKKRHKGRSAAFIYFKGRTEDLEVEFETEIPPRYVELLILLLTKIHFDLPIPLQAIRDRIEYSRHSVIANDDPAV